jgi:ABC-type multidrug transport system ATPase subunit
VAVLELSTTSDPNSVIECRGISKNYKNIFFKGEIFALTNVDISLDRGEICGLVGPNGAGKSTLIKVILGIESRQKGEIIISGELKQLGYVPEKPIFFEEEDAFHNLLYYARISQLDDPEKKCAEGLATFGLNDKGETLVNTFSKGMKQRLAIARSLLSDPDILIMDEPFSGLDPTAVIEIRGHLQNMKDLGKTILLSSHELNEIDKICDTIIFIDKGRIIRKESLHSTQVLVRFHVLLQKKSDAAMEVVRRMGLCVISKDDLNMIVEIERDIIPDLITSLVGEKARIIESHIIQRTSEDIYTEVFMKGATK